MLHDIPKACDPNLLSTVFAWELANEVFFQPYAGPWTRTSGNVSLFSVPPGNPTETFDMATTPSRKSCLIAAAQRYSKHFADLIHTLDPDALVSADWTGWSYADSDVRPPFTDANYARIGVQFKEFADFNTTKLDYLDAHFYGGYLDVGNIDYQPFETELQYIRNHYGVPFVFGEFGVLINQGNFFGDGRYAQFVLDIGTLFPNLKNYKPKGAFYWSWNSLEASGTVSWYDLQKKSLVSTIEW